MTKLPLLHSLLGILMLLAIAASYPVLKYGAQYAQLVSRVKSYNPYPHQSGTHLSIADSSDSSSGYRIRQCIFHRLPGQGLNTIPKIPRRQTNDMLAMKAPSVPASSTMKPRLRTVLVETSPPVTFLKIHSPGYQTKSSRIPATFTHAKNFGPISPLPSSEYPLITREFPLDATTSAISFTPEEHRGDA